MKVYETLDNMVACRIVVHTQLTCFEYGIAIESSFTAMDIMTRQLASSPQINLTYSAVDRSWSASIVDQDKIIWTSAEKFHSADTAYYRAIGKFVLYTSNGRPAHRCAHKNSAGNENEPLEQQILVS